MQTENDTKVFNHKVKSLVLRREFELENIYFNEKRGIEIASEFAEVAPDSKSQNNHKRMIVDTLKREGFCDCGDVFGYNKI